MCVPRPRGACAPRPPRRELPAQFRGLKLHAWSVNDDPSQPVEQAIKCREWPVPLRPVLLCRRLFCWMHGGGEPAYHGAARPEDFGSSFAFKQIYFLPLGPGRCWGLQRPGRRKAEIEEALKAAPAFLAARRKHFRRTRPMAGGSTPELKYEMRRNNPGGKRPPGLLRMGRKLGLSPCPQRKGDYVLFPRAPVIGGFCF